MPPLQHELEVANPLQAGQQLPVLCGVVDLCRVQLLGEETQQLPGGGRGHSLLEEVLQLLDVSRHRVVHDGLNPPLEWLNATAGNAVAREVQLGLPKLVVLCIGG